MKNKGCVNLDCRESQVRTHFDEKNKFCPQCGEELKYVCLHCHTVLSDGTNKYCIRCEAKKKDRFGQLKKAANNAGPLVVGIAGFAVNHKNEIIPIAKKAAPYVERAGKYVAKIIK